MNKNFVDEFMSNFNSMIENLNQELKNLNKEIHEGNGRDPNFYDDIYQRLGTILSDLSIFFLDYPDMVISLNKAINDSPDRVTRDMYQSLEKFLRDRFSSFISLKDTTLALERWARTKIYSSSGLDR